MECGQALTYMELLKEEGFSDHQIQQLLPKLEQVAELSKGERQELKERLCALDGADGMPVTAQSGCCTVTEKEGSQEETRELSPVEAGWKRMYSGFGGAVTELLRQNNQQLLEEMDTRISNRILKEMNYLFRERENLEEERYRKLDRTIRETQMLRQRKSIEEERRKKFRFLG